MRIQTAQLPPSCPSPPEPFNSGGSEGRPFLHAQEQHWSNRFNSTTGTATPLLITGKRTITKTSLSLALAILLCIPFIALMLHHSGIVHLSLKHLNLDHSARSSPIAAAHRVAVCIVGGSRSFPMPAIHESIHHNFLSLLHPTAQTDIFFKLQDTSGQEECRAMTNKYPNHTLSAAMDKFNPVYSDFQEPTCEEAVIDQSACCQSPHYHNASKTDKEWNSWRSYIRKTSCINQVLEYESDNDIEYDWVVLIRPDLVFLEPTMFRVSALIPNRVYASSKERGQPMGDYIYLIPRPLLADFNLALSVYNDPQCKELGHPTWPPEFPFHPYLEHTIHMPYQVLPFVFTLIRCAGHDACGRLDNESLHHAKTLKNGTNIIGPDKSCEMMVRHDAFFPDFIPYDEWVQSNDARNAQGSKP